MNKLKHSLGLLTMTFTAFVLSFAMAQSAFADPEPTPQDDRNQATTGIPFVHTMNAGATADLSDITYTLSITGTAKEDGTLGSYASTGIAPLTLPFTNGVITPATPDPAVDADRSSDAIKVWVDSKTLAQLFGSDNKTNTDAASGYPKFSANFPQAGIYKFTIAETRAGDAPSKWEYEPWKTDDAAEPPVDEAGTYTLVVFIANDTGAAADVTKRHYDGWYLLDNATGDKVIIDTTDNSESGADFTSTYKATSTLNVTKQVSGDYASTTHPFEQTITLYLPDWAANADIGVTGKNDGTWSPAEIPADGATERTYTVSLAHGQTVSFTNVPVGTRYKVQETTGDDGKAVDAASLKYSPTITWGEEDEEEADDSLPTGNRGSLSAYSLAEISSISANIAQKPTGAFATEFAGYVGQTIDIPLNAENEVVAAASEENKIMTVKLIGINQDVDGDGNKLGTTFMATHALPAGQYWWAENYDTNEDAENYGGGTRECRMGELTCPRCYERH